MSRWFRSYWAEEDTWFFFEVDTDGWVTRQVELQGQDETAIAAASLAESEAAQQAGNLAGYEAVFGATATVSVGEWEGYKPQDLTTDEFETVWLTARAACRAAARNRSTGAP